MSNIYTETFKVHTYEVDIHNRLTIHSLCQFLQESASNHAADLGLGVEFLLKNNRTWVLSKLAVDLKSPVELGEVITVKTWPSGTNKFFYTRDFLIENEGGNTVALAVSYWLFINTSSMRPIPPSKGEIVFDYGDIPEGFGRKLTKIPLSQNNNTCGIFQVRYSDLDLNNHVNNITYVKWIMEGIDPEFKKEHYPLYLEINYLREVKYGEEIKLAVEKLNKNHYLHSLSILGTEVCRAQSTWS